MDGQHRKTARLSVILLTGILILLLSLFAGSCADSRKAGSGVTATASKIPATAAATESSSAASTEAAGNTEKPTDTPSPVPVKDAGQDDKVPENGNKYIMDLTIDTDHKSIGGTMTVIVRNTSGDTWENLVFRDYPSLFTPDGDTGYKADGRVTDIGGIRDLTESEDLSYSRGADASVLGVVLKTPLAPGDMRKIAFSFTAYIPNIEGRFGYTGNTYNIANFYPVLAVYENGAWIAETYIQIGECFYSIISDYDVTISAPSDVTVIASGKTTGVTLSGGSRVWTVRAPGVRDFAIVAGTDYEVAAETSDGITINSYYLNGDIKWGEEALDAGVKAVNVFESEYGGYPYSELDIVETYLDAGGMEYPNLVMIDNELLAEGRADSFLGVVVAHETAHQWFYGVVGDNQFDEAWLDESFASYSELVYKESFMSDEEIHAEVDAIEAALDPEGIPVGPEDYYINRAYDEFYGPFVYVSAVYWRGEVFLYRLREAMGEDTFRTAIQEYYKDYSMKIATTEDFLTVIEKYAGDNPEVLALLDKYLEQ